MGLNSQEAIKTLKANYPTPNYSELREAVDMALAILREQEPAEPHQEYDSDDGTWYYGCGVCHEAIDPNDAYCRHCGRAVKWDD